MRSLLQMLHFLIDLGHLCLEDGLIRPTLLHIATHSVLTSDKFPNQELLQIICLHCPVLVKRAWHRAHSVYSYAFHVPYGETLESEICRLSTCSRGA